MGKPHNKPVQVIRRKGTFDKTSDGFVTELKNGEIITVDGPAIFKIIEMRYQVHSTRALVKVLAPVGTTISKGEV